jgi:putative transposase
MIACRELSPEVGAAAACRSLNIPRATYYYRRLAHGGQAGDRKRPAPPRVLGAAERERVLETLHCERFVDRAPAEIFASLLDEGIYLCSIRTMYRVLAAEGEVRERRNQLRHPQYQAPELLATAPNQVWSWDITKLRGPVKWQHYCLYVVLDIFSRYVVGWTVAAQENGPLARHMIAESCRKEGIQPGQVILHADRGAPMTAKPVAMLLSDLGVTRSHSRPHVSNDNPFSEAQFKTLKYCPEFPKRFGSIEDARSFCRRFFTWYNQEHRHGGIGLMTPVAVHHGRVEAVTQVRQAALSQAFLRNPERFVRGMPKPPTVPEAAWINKPTPDGDESEARVVTENDADQGVLGYGPSGDGRSWGTSEADLFDSASPLPQSYTKFESQVSQYH